MSHLDTAYKLGSVRAVEEFTDWMAAGDPNPTAAPPKLGHKIAKEVMEKLSKPKYKKRAPTARTPAGKGTRFQRLKAKLRKRK